MHPIITETLGTTWVDGLRGERTFELTVESAAEQARAATPSIVFLCSPNNPTGTALPFEVIGAVLDAAPDALVVVDEAYAEFARPGTPSALTLLAANPRLVVTRTMSKAFAFAGGPAICEESTDSPAAVARTALTISSAGALLRM